MPDERSDQPEDEDPEVIEGICRGLDQMDQGLGRPFDEFDAEFQARLKNS